MSSEMTIGDFLNQAERRILERGGYTAIVDCDTRQVRLFHTNPDGLRSCVAQGELASGVAPEDAASDLLEGLSATVIPEDLAFARDIYFPISLV